MDPEGPFTRLKKNRGIAANVGNVGNTVNVVNVVNTANVADDFHKNCFDPKNLHQLLLHHHLVPRTGPVDAHLVFFGAETPDRNFRFRSRIAYQSASTVRKTEIRAVFPDRLSKRRSKCHRSQLSHLWSFKKSYNDALSRKVFFFKVVLFEASQVFSYQSE